MRRERKILQSIQEGKNILSTRSLGKNLADPPQEFNGRPLNRHATENRCSCVFTDQFAAFRDKGSTKSAEHETAVNGMTSMPLFDWNEGQFFRVVNPQNEEQKITYSLVKNQFSKSYQILVYLEISRNGSLDTSA